MNKNIFSKLFYLYPTFLFGDPGVFDRWIWLRKNITLGFIKTLDAGCGSGAFSLYAAYVGNSVVGISFNAKKNLIATQRADKIFLKNIQFINYDLRKLEDLKDMFGSVDQIICFEMIEHILDDKKLIQNFYSLLKTGGKLLLTTPYKYYVRLPGDKISQSEDGGHVRWGYTHEELSDLLTQCRFTIEKKEFVTGFISQLLIRVMRYIASYNYFIAWAIIFFLRPLTLFDPFITRLIGFPYLSIAVVALKK